MDVFGTPNLLLQAQKPASSTLDDFTPTGLLSGIANSPTQTVTQDSQSDATLTPSTLLNGAQGVTDEPPDDPFTSTGLLGTPRWTTGEA